MKPTLLVLAAGMGSRYGGLKQMDGLGPNGETIMDYSVYDAIRAGFGKVVFVIRKSFEQDFRNIFEKRFGDAIQVEFVLQEIEFIPEGYTYNPERTKPWGTAHAVMMGAPVINEPFAVLNADDFYGQNSLQVVGDYLRSVAGKKRNYCMVAFNVGNTLSESGGVSRGVCSVDEHNNLTSVVERFNIEEKAGRITFKEENGQLTELKEDTPVSMNLWGFTPDYFEYSSNMFKEFLKENGENPKSEFYIPYVINQLIQNKEAEVKALRTSSKWFGVTYQEDRPATILRLNELIKKGEYPARLWKTN